MAPKKSTISKAIKTNTKKAKAIQRESKLDTKQIAKTFKALRDAFGRFTSRPAPKKVASKKSTKKKATKNERNKTKTKKSSSTKPGNKGNTSGDVKRRSKTTKLPSGKAVPSKQTKKTLLEILDTSNYSTYNAWAETVLANADAIDNVTTHDSKGNWKQGHYFVAQYIDGVTADAYENIEFLIQKLNTYEASKQLGERSDDAVRTDFLDKIEVRQIKGGASVHFDANRARKAERKQMQEQTDVEARELLGQSTNATRKSSRHEIIKGLVSFGKEATARADALEERLNKLEAMLSKPKKQATKKSTKKASKKNAGKSRVQSGSGPKSTGRKPANKTVNRNSDTKRVSKKAGAVNATKKSTNTKRATKAGRNESQASKHSGKTSQSKKTSSNKATKTAKKSKPGKVTSKKNR